MQPRLPPQAIRDTLGIYNSLLCGSCIYDNLIFFEPILKGHTFLGTLCDKKFLCKSVLDDGKWWIENLRQESDFDSCNESSILLALRGRQNLFSVYWVGKPTRIKDFEQAFKRISGPLLSTFDK